jgi:hypothetical protein
MTDNSELKGLRDIRTCISTHSRSTSRHKGTPYLEILALGMERLHLEAELARVAKRQRRIETRLEEMRQVMGDRLTQVRDGLPSDDGAEKAITVDPWPRMRRRPLPTNLRSIPLEY